MGLRVNSNISSINAQRNLVVTTDRLQKSLQRLSSGLRISRAADDAAGLAISESFRSEIRSLQQAQRNASDGISMLQIGEGALNESSTLLIRLRELAIQAANGTLGANERATVDNEFQDLLQEIDRIAAVTEFNGNQILQSAITTTFQIGTGNTTSDRFDVTGVNATTAAIGLSGIGVSTVTGARTSLALLDSAVSQIASLRARFGTAQNRLESAIRSIGIAVENTSAAESRIRDVDFAAETAELTRNQVLQQAGISVLAQANVSTQSALALLQ
ncbi:MAG TPA: flagellin FliC [Deltaproteobacteria bacterium]|nr:flagellin FliC [Deltaproteobacteria bacterium]